MRTIIYFLIFITFLILPLLSLSADNTVSTVPVGILSPEFSGIPPENAEQFTDHLREAIEKNNHFSVTTRPDEDGNFAFTHFSKIRNAVYMIKPQCIHIGCTYYASLELIETETTQVKKRADAEFTEWEHSGDILVGMVTDLTQRAAGEAGTGAVSVSTDPEGAHVFFNGQYAGRSPLTTALPPQRHEILVVKEGYKNLVGFVHVSADDTRPLTISLERKESETNEEFRSEQQFFVPNGMFGPAANFYLVSYPVYDALQIMKSDRFFLPSTGFSAGFYGFRSMINAHAGITLLSDPVSGGLSWTQGGQAFTAGITFAPFTARAVRLGKFSFLPSLEIGLTYQYDSYGYTEESSIRKLHIFAAETGAHGYLVKKRNEKSGWFTCFSMFASFPLVQRVYGISGELNIAEIAYENGAWDGQSYYWPACRTQISVGLAYR